MHAQSIKGITVGEIQSALQRFITNGFKPSLAWANGGNSGIHNLTICYLVLKQN